MVRAADHLGDHGFHHDHRHDGLDLADQPGHLDH